jgi:hypothetical protein
MSSDRFLKLSLNGQYFPLYLAIQSMQAIGIGWPQAAHRAAAQGYTADSLVGLLRCARRG